MKLLQHWLEVVAQGDRPRAGRGQGMQAICPRWKRCRLYCSCASPHEPTEDCGCLTRPHMFGCPKCVTVAKRKTPKAKPRFTAKQ